MSKKIIKEPTKQDVKEYPTVSTNKIITEEELKEYGVSANLIEKILLEINKKAKINIDNYKKDYHKYAQTGRYFTTTQIRRPKRNQYVCFVNLETDTLIIERIKSCDGITIKTKSYTYPLSLIKTIEIKLFPLLNFNSKIYIHLAIADISSLDIASKMQNLADSVFMKNLLQYGGEKLSDKPLFKIILGGLIGGLVFYFAMILIFRKIIVSIFQTNLPTPTA